MEKTKPKFNIISTYRVRERAKRITEVDGLDTLTNRKLIGIPLANDLRDWLSEQPRRQLLCIDFSGIRAVTLSVAEELGPLLMQAVQQTPDLEQVYPIFHLNSPEPVYTFASAFEQFKLSGLAMLTVPVESTPFTHTVAEQDSKVIVVLGQLTEQMGQILTFAEQRYQAGEALTSENLTELEFLSKVSAAARSKRLTELYTRRLLAFRENPNNPRERLFTPAWRL